jgi:ArsR family transcriptional regulator, arsenate/arsenite/antimonite-responsive transcriptional repressor
MKKARAVAALAALAQDSRLDAFRLLVQAGPDGMSAGRLAENLGVAPNTLTFHLDRLREADLITVERDGRSMIYSAHYGTMNELIEFLTENCCERARDPSRSRASQRVQSERKPCHETNARSRRRWRPSPLDRLLFGLVRR